MPLESPGSCGLKGTKRIVGGGGGEGYKSNQRSKHHIQGRRSLCIDLRGEGERGATADAGQRAVLWDRTGETEARPGCTLQNEIKDADFNVRREGSYWRLFHWEWFKHTCIFKNWSGWGAEIGKVRVGVDVERGIRRLSMMWKMSWLRLQSHDDRNEEKKINLSILEFKSTGSIFSPSRNLNRYWWAVNLRIYFPTSPWDAVILWAS